MNKEELELEELELYDMVLNSEKSFGVNYKKLAISLRAELELYKDNEEYLNNKIQKAIEYIENNSLYKEEVDYDYEENPIYVGCNDIKAREELLDILKGGNNE